MVDGGGNVVVDFVLEFVVGVPRAFGPDATKVDSVLEVGVGAKLGGQARFQPPVRQVIFDFFEAFVFAKGFAFTVLLVLETEVVLDSPGEVLVGVFDAGVEELVDHVRAGEEQEVVVLIFQSTHAETRLGVFTEGMFVTVANENIVMFEAEVTSDCLLARLINNSCGDCKIVVANFCAHSDSSMDVHTTLSHEVNGFTIEVNFCAILVVDSLCGLDKSEVLIGVPGGLALVLEHVAHPVLVDDHDVLGFVVLNSFFINA